MGIALSRAATELRGIVDGTNGVGRRDAARRVGVAKSTLDKYLSGHALPSGRNRSRIEREFPRVASRWWDEPAEKTESAA